MATITITIEDSNIANGVKVTASPSFADIMSLAKNGKLTSAHGYAIAALNSIREKSKESKLIVPVPRVRLN